MALMLALSMVVGMTGAFFTDNANANQDGTLEFGQVSITLADDNDGAWTKLGLTSGTANAYVVPGSEYAGKFTLANNGTEDVYFKLSATGNEAKIEVGGTPITTGVTIGIAIDTLASGCSAVAGHDGVYKLNAGSSQKFSATISLATTMGNEVDGVTLNSADGNTAVQGSVTLKIAIDAVQVANNSSVLFA